MDKYVVFGNPIAQSKSPLIHTLFARQTAQAMTYTAELAPVDGFKVAAENFFSQQMAAGAISQHLSKKMPTSMLRD